MEQLGYIALGCVLILVVLGLRRVDWSKIRLPKFGRAGVGVGARTKNSVLLSIAVHAVLALIGALRYSLLRRRSNTTLSRWSG